jgi:hypothetical protein
MHPIDKCSKSLYKRGQMVVKTHVYSCSMDRHSQKSCASDILTQNLEIKSLKLTQTIRWYNVCGLCGTLVKTRYI